MLLARYLESLPDHVRLFAGSLNVFGVVELGDFLTIFKSFREGIRKRFGNSVKFRPVTEVGPRSGRLHLHYAMTSDGIEVTKAEVESIWREACGGRRVRVFHVPMWDIAGWSRYLWKDGWKYHDPSDPKNCVVLFSKGSPKLPQATPGFFPSKIKAAFWAEWKAEQERRRRASEGVETRSGTAVPQIDPTTNVVINTSESIEKNRASEPVETFSGTVVPRLDPTTKVRIRVGKSSMFNRVPGQFRAGLMRLSHRNQGTKSHSRRYRGDIRDHRQSRPVSHRLDSEVRSIGPMPERRLAGLSGRLVRGP
jgi:hypothetical protein